MLKKEWMSRLSAAGLAALFVFGCSPESTGSKLVTVQVSLARADAAPSAALAPQDVSSGVIDLTNIDALTMNLVSVQLQSSGSGGWQTVTPTAPLTLDLTKDLSTQPIDLGTATLEPGACEARLFVSDATISFKQSVTVGPSTFDAAPTTYPVTIPSGPQTGLKPEGSCEISTVNNKLTLAFDVGASVMTIVATGNGNILLTPVIHIHQP